MTDKELLLAISDILDKKFKIELTPIKQDIEQVKQNIEQMRQDVELVKQDVELVKQDVELVKQDIKVVNQRLTSIELTLENETNSNISIIAEGHQILNRRLDEALKVESEKEMLMIRVNCLENELRKLKEQVSQIA